MSSIPKIIEITCTGTESLPLAELVPYNVRLKDRKESDIASLARKIINKGFSFPVFVWNPPDSSQNLILDGNGRYLALQWLERHKYKIPDRVPIIRIFAVDEVQARKKVLELNTLNGKISQDAFLLFVRDLQIDFSDYTIPCLDATLLKNIQSERIGFFLPDTPDEEPDTPAHRQSKKQDKPEKMLPAIGGNGDRHTSAKCPHCGMIHEITF